MTRPAERRPAVTHTPRTISAASIPPEMFDADALRVIARLEREGHQAYLVGGCVRDLLIGRTPKDFDVATDAHPRQIKRLFRNGRIIGRRFKLVHIHYGGHIIETATFRSDPFPRESEAETGDDAADAERDLDNLLITEDNEFGTAEEDARRRDFTVNAIFLDPTKRTVIDYVGGLEDLERGMLRTIGDPSVRLAEDPVRILRAVKFATRLGFRIDDATWSAMCEIAPRLSRSAPPRVLEEILRLMRSGTALGSFRMLRACGALSVILPAIDRYLGQKDDPAAQARAEGFWRLLEALDADVHQGFTPSTSVCIALLYLRIIEREADPATREMKGAAPDLAIVTAEVLVPVGLQTRLPRRETARARKIILLQRKFVQAATKRFRPISFLKSDEFLDALELFRLRIAARGQGWDIYEGWKERHRLAQSLPASEVEAERGPRRRRRRKHGSSGASPGVPG